MLVVLASVTMLAGAAQDDKPNYSGTWTLDIAKSDFGMAPPPESMVSVIEHAEPSMKIKTTQKSQMGEMTNERLVTTDGKENENKLRTMMGDQNVKSTTKWDGKKLITAYALDIQGMSLDVKETWELSADGKVLTIMRDIKTPQGDFSQKNILNKS